MTNYSPLLADARALLIQAKHVAAFIGAGLSAESGISTFRGAQADALWSRFDPAALASREGFFANPEHVIEWYNWRRQTLAKASPNPGHVALGKQKRLIQITQNVDNLLERAGVPGQHIYHLHGTITKDRCDAFCGYERTLDLEHPPSLGKCPQCGHFLRPAVVWFGEGLPLDTWKKAESLCARIDCLLVIGTSASVYPASGLIHTARNSGARIIIVNTQPSDVSDMASVELTGPSGEILPELLEGLDICSFRNG